MSRCTNERVKEKFLDIFKNFGFNIDSSISEEKKEEESEQLLLVKQEKEKEKENLLKIIKPIYNNLISKKSINIVKNLYLAKNKIKSFWYNYRDYRDYNVNYNNKLCNNI
jgi:hypothetical protein